MAKTVAELHAQNLPHATCKTLGLTLMSKDAGEGAVQTIADVTAEINQYLQSFTIGPNCPGCGEQLGGLFGTFQWGIRAGEGSCSYCRYPARAHHATKSLSDLNTILPYHPDLLVAYSGSPDFELEKAGAKTSDSFLAQLRQAEAEIEQLQNSTMPEAIYFKQIAAAMLTIERLREVVTDHEIEMGPKDPRANPHGTFSDALQNLADELPVGMLQWSLWLRRKAASLDNAACPEPFDGRGKPQSEILFVRLVKCWKQLRRQQAEIKQLQAWKDDIEDSMKSAADETCDAGERHCTCVPLLRVEIKRLQQSKTKHDGDCTCCQPGCDCGCIEDCEPCRRLSSVMKRLGNHPLVVEQGGTDDVDRVIRVINKQQTEIEQLREALDVIGWDEWFIRLQSAVRGNESLINECGERIERTRKAANAAKGE